MFDSYLDPIRKLIKLGFSKNNLWCEASAEHYKNFSSGFYKNNDLAFMILKQRLECDFTL